MAGKSLIHMQIGSAGDRNDEKYCMQDAFAPVDEFQNIYIY